MKNIWFIFFRDAVVFYCESYNQNITVVSEQKVEVLNITSGRTYI
jgi:hypothetical protein